MRTSLLAALALIALVGLAGAMHISDAPPPAGSQAATTREPPALPSPTADKPADMPGLHNVVAFAPGVLSGAVPEGEEAFKTLRALGIKTIISVDGAQPDADLAKKYGLRYVHLPIGYNGLSPERTLEIARAIRDLRAGEGGAAAGDAPIYIHCHHGKHRSAGAAGAAAVTLGLISPEQAVARMKVSGTAPAYTGLYACAADAKPADKAAIDGASAAFPEHAKTTGLVQSMVEMDEVFEHLKQIKKAGWTTPKDHPDLVPAAEAGRLADLFRDLRDDEQVTQKPLEFTMWLFLGRTQSETLERLLTEELGSPKRPTNKALDEQFEMLTDGCKQCHVKYRD